MRQVDGKAGRLVDVGQGWSLIGIMMAVRLVTSPTCSLVVGPGAQARMCRRREDVLRLLSASSTGARREGCLTGPEARSRQAREDRFCRYRRYWQRDKTPSEFRDANASISGGSDVVNLADPEVSMGVTGSGA